MCEHANVNTPLPLSQRGQGREVRVRRQKFIDWKAIYVDPIPQHRGVAEIAPYFNFHNSGNAYAAPNVEFRGFMRRMTQFGRTVFMVFRDAWGQITMIPNNMIKSLIRVVPVTPLSALIAQHIQIQHVEEL